MNPSSHCDDSISDRKPAWAMQGMRAGRYLRSVVILFLAIYFMILPALQIICYLRDPGLQDGGMCSFLYRWHRDLSQRYEVWAKERLASDKAAQLDINNVSGTEWPLFGSVFYLWSTEALQDAWNANPELYQTAPVDYARGAIEASAALLADSAHATWVKQYWGEDYLEKENLFYRMLLIHAMISYQTLLGDDRYESLLVQQVDSLAAELDASPFGLLDDYPGQCYPVDIMPAYAAIKRADALLGTDHSAMVSRGLRAFQDTRLDSATGLPAYNVDSETGYNLSGARGVGVSFMLIWAPEIWPGPAAQWYNNYEEHFWQTNRLVAGFREFPRSESFDRNWMVEVDAGPVMAGFGMGASAFGLGAARANGRMDHAYSLAALALTGAWRLPDGTLPLPRLLSDLTDAPYLGEAALLFSLTRQPVVPVLQQAEGHTPLLIILILVSAIIAGGWLVLSSIVEIKRTKTGIDPYAIPLVRCQLIFCVLLVIFAIGAFVGYGLLAGQIALLVAVIFPYIQRKKKKRPPKPKDEATSG